MDQTLKSLLEKELLRQRQTLSLIASENYCSEAVIHAQSSVATNKYAEGYPHKRYYAGCQVVDEIENLAIARLKTLFGVEYANVQPHSGSQANLAVFQACLGPDDCYMGLDLNDGGHLSHGCRVNISGQNYNAVSYHVDKETELLDYDQIEALAKIHKPKMIIAGYSAYAPSIDWQRFRQIADSVGAYLHADIAHIAGLIAAGLYPSPVPYADVITSTTHKTLRGPRGGLIMVPRSEELAKRVDKAIFPGIQGGPMMMTIAAKAAAFYEALQPDFKHYQQQVLNNASAMASRFQEQGFDLVSGGTQSHLFMVKLDRHGLTGKEIEHVLESVHILVNKNSIPGDTRSPFITSGIRIGTPGITTRGLVEDQAKQLADWMIKVIMNKGDQKILGEIKKDVLAMANKFTIYDGFER